MQSGLHLFLVLSVAAPALKERPDPKSLVGTWRVECYYHLGVDLTDVARPMTITFSADGTFVVGHRKGARKYKTDAASAPATIDAQSEEHVNGRCKGIYRINGDVLCLCHREADEDRPTDLPPDRASLDGLDWSDVTVAILTRVRPKN